MIFKLLEEYKNEILSIYISQKNDKMYNIEVIIKILINNKFNKYKNLSRGYICKSLVSGKICDQDIPISELEKLYNFQFDNLVEFKCHIESDLYIDYKWLTNHNFLKIVIINYNNLQTVPLRYLIDILDFSNLTELGLCVNTNLSECISKRNLKNVELLLCCDPETHPKNIELMYSMIADRSKPKVMTLNQIYCLGDTFFTKDICTFMDSEGTHGMKVEYITINDRFLNKINKLSPCTLFVFENVYPINEKNEKEFEKKYEIKNITNSFDYES